MSSATPVRVRLLEHPTDQEIEEATALAARAFPWDNASIAMTGNNPSLKPHIFGMQFGAARVAGRMYVVSPQDSDKILATGLWFGPGTTMMRTEEQRAAGFNQFLELLDPETRNWWLKEYPEALKIADDAYGKDGMLNNWYANLIATDPEHQGKGYGTLMVQAGMKRAVEDGKFAALATISQELVDWYTHLGFTQIAEAWITGPKTTPIRFWATWLRCDKPKDHV